MRRLGRPTLPAPMSPAQQAHLQGRERDARRHHLIDRHRVKRLRITARLAEKACRRVWHTDGYERHAALTSPPLDFPRRSAGYRAVRTTRGLAPSLTPPAYLRLRHHFWQPSRNRLLMRHRRQRYDTSRRQGGPHAARGPGLRPAATAAATRALVIAVAVVEHQRPVRRRQVAGGALRQPRRNRLTRGGRRTVARRWLLLG